MKKQNKNKSSKRTCNAYNSEYPFNKEHIESFLEQYINKENSHFGRFLKKLNKKVFSKLMKNKEYLFASLYNIYYPSLISLDYVEFKDLLKNSSDISFETISFKDHKSAKLRGVNGLIITMVVNQWTTLDKISSISKYFAEQLNNNDSITSGARVMTNLKKNENYALLFKMR